MHSSSLLIESNLARIFNLLKVDAAQLRAWPQHYREAHERMEILGCDFVVLCLANKRRERRARAKIYAAYKVLIGLGLRVSRSAIERLSGCAKNTVNRHSDIWKTWAGVLFSFAASAASGNLRGWGSRQDISSECLADILRKRSVSGAAKRKPATAKAGDESLARRLFASLLNSHDPETQKIVRAKPFCQCRDGRHLPREKIGKKPPKPISKKKSIGVLICEDVIKAIADARLLAVPCPASVRSMIESMRGNS